MRDWRKIALWLVGGTMAYNVVEAVVALWAGWEAESIALVPLARGLRGAAFESLPV